MTHCWACAQNEGSLPKLLSRLSGLFGGPAASSGVPSSLPSSNSFFPTISGLPSFGSQASHQIH